MHCALQLWIALCVTKLHRADPRAEKALTAHSLGRIADACIGTPMSTLTTHTHPSPNTNYHHKHQPRLFMWTDSKAGTVTFKLREPGGCLGLVLRLCLVGVRGGSWSE